MANGQESVPERTPGIGPISAWESPNLDLLRTVAVLLVVVAHILEYFGIIAPGGRFMQLGRFGVLLFFVHTSMVLMMSLARQRSVPYARHYLVFLVRRCFRIYPLSILIVGAVCSLRIPVAHLLGHTFVGIPLDTRTVASNLALVQNVTRADSVLAPLWSLPYEMQMYLLLPFLFAAVVRYGQFLSLLLLWLCGVTLAVAWKSVLHDDAMTYVPCFLGGVIGYGLSRKGRAFRLPFLGWPLLLLATTIFFQFHWGEKSGWGCCLLIGIAVSRFRELSTGWLHSACQTVARYSYGIYLTHFVCLWLAFQGLHDLPVYVRWAVFALSATLSPFALYHSIEAPLIAIARALIDRFATRGHEAVPVQL